MLLITEQIFDNIQVSEEINEETNKKNLHIKGVFLQAEQKNKNGRIYPKNILKKEVDKYISEYILKNRSMGELKHPKSPEIDPDRVSHRVVSLTENGNNWIGDAIILDTPCGNTVRGLLEGGCLLGVSSRGMGSIEFKKGVGYIQEDYEFKCIDIVTDPSAPEAFVNGIMEGVDWIYQDGIYKAIEKDLEDAKNKINNASKYSLNSVKIEVFENIMNKLEQLSKFEIVK